MSYLLDTCVVSELASPRPAPGVVRWIDGLDDEQVFLSVVTIGEIRRGIARLPVSTRRNSLDEWLRRVLLRFQANLVPIDAAVALEWGALTAELDRAGRPMPALDSLIAASAKLHQFTLATRNISDFENSGIVLFNPWDGT